MQGWLLHYREAFLLEGTVQRSFDKGFSFLVGRTRDLRKALAGAEMQTPKAVRHPGGFVRTSRRGRGQGSKLVVLLW